MVSPYVQHPASGESRTREFLVEFLEDYKPFVAGLIGGVPIPLDTSSIYTTRAANSLKRYIGRASHAASAGNGDEYAWCVLSDISKAIGTLTKPQQTVLGRYYYCGLELNEIADAMQLTDPEVCDLLRGALDDLAFFLDN